MKIVYSTLQERDEIKTKIRNFLDQFSNESTWIELFSVPSDFINLCGKIGIRKSRHYGGQVM